MNLLHVRMPGHVDAHLLTCMIALAMLRIIRKRLSQTGLACTASRTWRILT